MSKQSSTKHSVANQSVLTLFQRLLSKGKIGHAYLLIGPPSSGKLETAKAIAQLVNCDGLVAPCGQCSSCLKIAAGNHIDVSVLLPEEDKQSVSIEQVRHMLSRIGLSAYEARYKVFIVPHVEQLTTDAANAFLKTLEEPAARTMLILTTTVPENVLDTIRSRCQWLRLFPNMSEDLVKKLTDEGLSVADAKWLARFVNGYAQTAMDFKDDETLSQRQELVQKFLSLGVDDDTIKGFADERSVGRLVTMVLLSALRDALTLKARGSVLWHEDCKDLTAAMAKRPMAELLVLYKQLIDTNYQLKENLNAKMAFALIKEHAWKPSSK